MPELARITETLLYYDGPQAERGMVGDNAFLATALRPEEYGDEWTLMVIVMLPETLEEVLCGKITLHDAYTIHRVGPAYTGQYRDKESLTLVETGEPVW